MASFAVTLSDQTTDVVDGADAYQQEGPLTTFFSFAGDRHVIDSWSIRLASYRTSDISAIRRHHLAQGPFSVGDIDGIDGIGAGTELAHRERPCDHRCAHHSSLQPSVA
jgi:hypothetical protein